jgi:predicted PurR-regulated permease PerM
MTALRTRLEQNLGGGIVALLFIGCLLVLWPFVTVLLWGAVLSYSAWPLYVRLLHWLGGRRTLAALCVSLAMVLVVLVPFLTAGLTLAGNVTELKTAAQQWLDRGPPAPPAWLSKLPAIGPTAAEKWRTVAADSAKLLQELRRFIEPAAAWVLKVGLKLGGGLFELALSILITFFLLRNGTSAAGQLTAVIERIAGERGRPLLELAGNTIRGVVYGVLGTALVQGLMAGFGFLIAGVPGAPLLALLTCFLSLVPVGPVLVWLPAALWLFNKDETGWGIFMVVWGVGVSLIDNFVKPWLISQGSDMPIVLILFGVLGGAMAFGFIGIFIGPTLLAVIHRLVKEWVAASHLPATAKQADASAPAPGV